MTELTAEDRFRVEFERYSSDFLAIDLRVVALNHNAQLLCVAGRAMLADCPVEELQAAEDLAQSDEVVLLQERLSISALPTLIKQIDSGEIEILGKKVVFHEGIDVRRAPQFSDNMSVWYGSRNSKMGFSLEWSLINDINKVLGYEALRLLENRLGALGNGYRDLPDLIAGFISGFEANRTIRPTFQIFAPINIEVLAGVHEKSFELRMNVGPTIDRNKLRFVAILREGQLSRRVSNRVTFQVPVGAWVRKPTGYSAEKIVPRNGESSCEVLVVYGGRTVRTHLEGVGYDRRSEKSDEQKEPNPPLKPGESDELVVLAADLAGSTKLKEKLGADLARPLLDDWEAHFRGLIPSYGGFVMKWSGDGGLACFSGDGKHQRSYAAAQHLLYYTIARKTRPISGWDNVKVRIALHCGVLKWEKDPGSIKSHDIDVVCHIESRIKPDNSIAATETFLKKLPSALKRQFRSFGRIDSEKVYRTDLALAASNEKSRR